MDERSRVVAVTGAAGYVGSRLLQELEEEDSLSKVVAIDTKPLVRPVHNILAQRLDVKDPLDEVFHDLRVDTVVHLASVLTSAKYRRNTESAREANVDGMRGVLKSCAQARVRNFIYLSSHTVYGPHRDNPVPITEDAPMRPLQEFPYSYDKAVSEGMVQKYAEENPDSATTVLRCCVVLGPSADNEVARSFFKPVLLGVMGNDPPWQFVHEDDLARLLTLMVMDPRPGIFNVAGEGVVRYSKIARLAGCKLIRLPPTMAYAATQLTWSLGIQRESPARGLDYVRYPMILSTGKLKKETSFRFKFASEEALTAFLASNIY